MLHKINPSPQTSISFKSGLKLLGIIACWELAIMSLLMKFRPIPSLGDEFLDTGLLTLLDAGLLTIFSGISIWFLILHPEKKKAQKEFSSSIHLMGQEILAMDKIGIVSATDINGKIIYANDNFCKISGYTRDELINKDHRLVNSGVHSKEFFQKMWSTLKEGKSWRGEVCNRRKDGKLYWVESYVMPIFDDEGTLRKYVSFRFDITADKQIEEALEQEKIKSLHMGRLSVIGEMASGIAHEINNPLAIINGLNDVIKRKLESQNFENEIPKIIDCVDKTKKQIVRVTKIINGLREFSRSGDDQPFAVVSARVVLESVYDLCSDKLAKSKIRFEIVSDEVEFQCNIIQIEQVLVNLINNAADAIAKLEERWIKISVNTDHDFVEFSVTDSGHGINKDIAMKIMQPFFTTKEIGKGTGLGLSISHGIIQNHGGVLYPDSNAANTRFVVKLPVNESSLVGLLDLDACVREHLKCKEHFINHVINSGANLDHKLFCSHSHCKVGKWLERIEPRFKNNSNFIELKCAHTEYYEYTSALLEQIKAGEKMPLESAFAPDSEFERLSANFISLIKSFHGKYSAKIELQKCG